jgi:alpha-galactosidase
MKKAQFIFNQLIVACFLLLLFSCEQKNSVEQTASFKENFSVSELQLKGDTTSFNSEINSNSETEGIIVYTLKLSSDEAKVPGKMTLHWRIPSADICGQWTTQSHKHKFLYPEWSGNANVTSNAASNSPVFTLYSQTDQNKITFACSDALNKVTLHAGVKEEDGFFDCEVILFNEKVPAFKNYEIEIRIDTRNIHFSESLNEVAEWWASMPAYKPLPVPEHARLPMYSSWYSFHQNLVVDDVLEQCRLAKDLGYESIIIDDGWQTIDNNRGYAFTGDWQPERIPEFENFVDSVHQIGMKFILWYSVPYIGEKSENYEQFKGKFLNYWGGKWGGSYTLDPRYPEVREFLIETYAKALTEWNIDGFKLDFIDSFFAKDNTKMTLEDGRDYSSVNEAVDRLMTDITKRLIALKPDVLIEFRQSYIGPLMRKYGNMFRAGDCPNSYHYNRVRITDLRLLSGNTAVHSDMQMWHPEDPVESAAMQLIHTIFSVPQLSVRIDKIPEDHKEMVRFWNTYWLANRAVLLDGKFTCTNPANNYTQLSASDNSKQIVAVYTNELVKPLSSIDKLDIINGKMLSGIVVDVAENLAGKKYIIYNCKGESTEEGKLKQGLQILNVPAAGVVQINKQ